MVAASPMFRRVGGMALATVITSHGVRLWKPARVVLMGIAGSIEPDKLQLGDVVVSDHIYGYEVGDAEAGEFNFRSTVNQIGALDFDRVRAFRDDAKAYTKWQQECLKAAPVAGLKQVVRPPELHLEAIASGNFVVKTTILAEQLKRQISPKIKAVEMEAEGLFRALYLDAGRSDALMIRGISDYADENKQKLEQTTKDGWRTFAAANAARLLRTFWRRGPVQPISPGYKLDLTLGPFSRFRQAGVPNIEFKKVGAQDTAFPYLLNRHEPTPELTLDVSAVLQAGQPAFGFRGVCIVESPKRTILNAQLGKKGIMSFQLPESEWGLKIELLLSFPFRVDQIKVVCKDRFFRKSEAVFTSSKRRR